MPIFDGPRDATPTTTHLFQRLNAALEVQITFCVCIIDNSILHNAHSPVHSDIMDYAIRGDTQLVTQRKRSETGKPRPASKQPALVILVGLPGTGKSFLARQIARLVPIKVVETDDIRHRIAHPPTYSRIESARVYQTAHRLIASYLHKGRNVIFDATNLYERGRETLYQIAEKNGARLLIVHTTAPEDVIQTRLQRRKMENEPQDKSEAGWDVYLRMKGDFEEIKRPHLEVDTSLNLQSAIDTIVKFVAN